METKTANFKLAYAITPLIRSLLLIPYILICGFVIFVFLFLFKREDIKFVAIVFGFVEFALIIAFISTIIHFISKLFSKTKIIIENGDFKYKDHCIKLYDIRKMKFDIGNFSKHFSKPSEMIIYYKKSGKIKSLKIERAPIKLCFYLKENIKDIKFEFLNYKEIVKFNPIFSLIIGIVLGLVIVFSI